MIRFNVWVTLFLISLLGISGCQAVGGAPLCLELELNQEMYRPGEYIEAHVTLRNCSDEPVLANQRMAPTLDNSREGALRGEVSFMIITPEGIEPFINVRVDNRRSPQERDFREMEPDETVSRVYPISEYFSPLYLSGEYSVQAIYRNDWDLGDGRVAWEGEIFSNVVHYTVLP